MRLRLMATYRGVPYQAGLGPDGTEATLFSPGPPPEELGFTAAAGHWRKQISLTDLDALWQSRPVGDYRGEPCLVLDDQGDRLHIAYLGRDAARAGQLGYWEIDREVFEVVVARDDVTGLTEERVEFPLSAAMFPPSGAEPAPEAQAAAPSVAPVASVASVADNGYAPLSESAGFAEYHGASANGEVAGNGQQAGYGDPDHAPRRPDRMAAWHGSPEPWPGPQGDAPAGPRTERPPGPEPWTEDEPWSDPLTEQELRSRRGTAPASGRPTGRKDRISPESVFAELLSLAAIPEDAYAVDEEIPGAMCLVEADGGFEVFSRTDHARLEVRFFEDEEAAYFYLFGVLAAEAIRSGRLGPNGSAQANGHVNGSVREDVSRTLRSRKLPKSAPHAARVYLAGGADGPPLPKQPRRPPKLKLTNLFCVSQIGLFTSSRHIAISPWPGQSRRPGTVAGVTGSRGSRAPLVRGDEDPGPALVSAGVASLAVRDVLRGPRRAGQVLASLPDAIYLEFADVIPEPRVIAISPPGALRLPNAIVTGPWKTRTSQECWAGEGRILACGLDIRIMRWWDPSPVFGPLSRARLDHGCSVLAKLCATADRAPGLAGHDGPVQLAACCASGDLAGAVEAVEQLVGLGPGLVPSGDSVVSGVLLALRLLGGAISGGTRAVWLANWLSASATCYAAQRTTTLAASLLSCAASGQAAAEVSAVLLGMAGQEPLEPAAAKLLAAGQGADLAWGLVAGCHAALLLSVS
jgi:hypothetical protein